MTAPTSIRGVVKTYLVATLAATLDPIPVAHGWPGRNIERDHVWVDRVTGFLELPLLTAGRKFRDDKFTVRVAFQASAPGDDIAETVERVLALYAHVENLLADDPGLGEMDGLISAALGPVEGPDGSLTDEGAVSFVFADIAIHARLS